jgi:hypothetical protein
MDPFLDLTVAPAYGKNSCVVRWQLARGFSVGDVYVYRSEDGMTGWDLLNPATPVRGMSYFEDTDFVVRDLLTTPHYRLLLEYGGKSYDSPIVGIFEKLNRKEFGIVRRILQLELKAMREGRQGNEVRILSPLTRGPTCRCVDPTTKQSSQASLCPYCYGTRIEGGFGSAVTTWMRFIDENPLSRVDDPTGKHAVDQNTVKCRALTIPGLITGDLVVHAPTDLRMAVVSAEVEYFRGLVPIVCSPSMVVLPRSDIRYQVPLS